MSYNPVELSMLAAFQNIIGSKDEDYLEERIAQLRDDYHYPEELHDIMTDFAENLECLLLNENVAAQTMVLDILRMQENSASFNAIKQAFDNYIDLTEYCLPEIEGNEIEADKEMRHERLAVEDMFNKLLSDIDGNEYNELCDLAEQVDALRKPTPLKVS